VGRYQRRLPDGRPRTDGWVAVTDTLPAGIDSLRAHQADVDGLGRDFDPDQFGRAFTAGAGRAPGAPQVVAFGRVRHTACEVEVESRRRAGCGSEFSSSRLRPRRPTVVSAPCARAGAEGAAQVDSDVTTIDRAETPTGAEPVWRELVTQLRAFVLRRIADPDRADDLVAEILLRVHENLPSLEDRELLPNWMFRIARNAVIDEYRRAARARERPVATLAEEPAPAPDEDEPGVLGELVQCLRPLLAGLPAEQRRAVELVELDGLAQAEAARREGISLSGMKSRVQRGRRRLAELLDQCCTLTLDARGVPMDYARPARCGCAQQ
jgi:RNA polymerase sigma-70 factor, ECF subfamily